jgi:hypothetical protein
MPRTRIHEPLNPAQRRTAHLLGFQGLWGKKVTPKVETTVVVDGTRFALDDQGRAKVIDGDQDKAKLAMDLLAHEGLKG